MERPYVVIVTLRDGTQIKAQKDYNFGFLQELNNPINEFVEICSNTFRKSEIVSVITKENPNYKEIEEDDNEDNE